MKPFTIARPDDSPPVNADDYTAVIDLLNRLNMAFDIWDIDAMMQAFAPEVTVTHPRGDVNGHDELRSFFDQYQPLTNGVRRHQINHVVDTEDNGDLTVTSYNLLIRIAAADNAETVNAATVATDTTGLPAVETWSVIIDRLRHYPDTGWRIVNRRVPQTIRGVLTTG